jgi:V/A-type H+-transporting ATPase subunit I
MAFLLCKKYKIKFQTRDIEKVAVKLLTDIDAEIIYKNNQSHIFRKEINKVEYLIESAEKVLRAVSRKQKKSFAEKVLNRKIVVNTEELAAFEDQALEDSIVQARKKLDLAQEKEEQENDQSNYSLFNTDYEHAFIRFFVASKSEFKEILSRKGEFREVFGIEIVKEQEKNVYFTAFGQIAKKAETVDFLEALGAQNTDYIEDNKQDFKLSQRQSVNIDIDQERLKKYIDYLRFNLAILRFSESVYEESAAHLDLYIYYPSKKVEKLCTDLQKQGVEVTVENSPTPQDKIRLKNIPLLTPFEEIVKVVGLPERDGFDPTPLIAPFFVFLFGFGISDAGYGLAIMLATFLLLKFRENPPEFANILKIIFFGSIPAFIFGILFGSYFGLGENDIQGTALSFLLELKILDPLQDPVFVLYLSLLLGAVHIIIGLIASAYLSIRSKNYSKIVKSYSTITLIVGAMSLVAGDPLNFPSLLTDYGATIAIIGLVGIFLSEFFIPRNPIKSFFSGINGIYGLIGYFSDILSYSRLLAMALATGIVGSVVNIVATLTLGVPFLGFLIFPLVLIFGHIFNLMLVLLSTYINVSRLHYVEMMPKFYSPNGAPLKINSLQFKNIKLLSNN